MKYLKLLSLIATVTTSLSLSSAHGDEIAKQAFGAIKVPSATQPASIGFYAKGCLSGAAQLPIDGPHWQVMRLSRNRNWGHPSMIALLENLSESAAREGWNGLLVGDISQPRGGPMLTGHASHQVGLDADIWLTPMPNYRFSPREREDVSAISMLKGNSLYVDPGKWTSAHTALIRLAAQNSQVERLFVHPGIKKQLCDTVRGDRSWLGKVRPYWGHYYHFHIRMKCQSGSPECLRQAPVVKGDGCDKSLAWWFTDEPWVPKKTTPGKTPPKPKPLMVSSLPRSCAAILASPNQKSGQ